MEENHYLPVAFKLAGHYEVEKVLGEDDFEILYLVKDLHLGEQQFVLKELFLPSYCARNDDSSLYVMAKSKQVFEQTKKDIIDEIELIKKSNDVQVPKLYGYFEENNTLYTIMEFINDANISPYLSVKEKEEKSIQTEDKNPKSFIFVKILIVCVLIFLGLVFYAYQMLEADKQKVKERLEAKSVKVIVDQNVMPHPTLEDKVDKKDVNEESIEEAPVKEIENLPKDASYIELSEMENSENTVLEGVPKEEVIQLETGVFEEEVVYPQQKQIIVEEEIILPNASSQMIEVPTTNVVRPNILLGRRIN